MTDDMSFSDSPSYDSLSYVSRWMSYSGKHVLRDQNENDKYKYKQGSVEDYTQRLREMSIG